MGSIKRKECPSLIGRNQELALSSTIYILRNIGPLGFCLKEEGESKEYKVFIGSHHTCTCNAFQKERDLCRHICWVILKRLKISKDNPISFQLGLNDRDIEGILTETKKTEVQPIPVQKQSCISENSDSTTLRKTISDEDVCPICQENFLEKHWPITYCRNGCGNNVHIRCMKIWSDHQIKDFGPSVSDIVKCPYCRGDFCTVSQLKKEYRNDPTRLMKYKNEVSCLAEKKIELNAHEESDIHYEVNENKDDEKTKQNKRQLVLKLMESVPSHMVPSESRLTSEGVQCCICLKPFQAREFIGRLACRHRFHKNCLINWFTENQPVCPIDQTPVEIKSSDTSQAKKFVTNNKKLNDPKTDLNFLLCGRNMANESTILEEKNTVKPKVLTRPFRRNRNFNSVKNNSDAIKDKLCLDLDNPLCGIQYPIFGKNVRDKYSKIKSVTQQKRMGTGTGIAMMRESKIDIKNYKNLSTDFTLIGNKCEKN